MPAVVSELARVAFEHSPHPLAGRRGRGSTARDDAALFAGRLRRLGHTRYQLITPEGSGSLGRALHPLGFTGCHYGGLLEHDYEAAREHGTGVRAGSRGVHLDFYAVERDGAWSIAGLVFESVSFGSSHATFASTGEITEVVPATLAVYADMLETCGQRVPAVCAEALVTALYDRLGM